MSSVLNLILGLVATLAALALIVGWMLSGRLLRRRSPDPPCPPDTFELPFEHVTFAARDGVMLGGWLVGERGRRPVVIFCAGMFGSMDGDTHLAAPFVAAGLDVLMFDWRAHGISNGQRVSLGVTEIDDALGAVDFLQSRGVTRIGMMGFSFGGALALRAAARDGRVRCVACDGGFVTIPQAMAGYVSERAGPDIAALMRPFLALVLWLVEIRLGRRLREASPMGAVGEISPRPVLLIHGADDPIVPVRDQDALFAACAEPKSLWRVEGAGHREAHETAPDEYRRRVVDFFRASL